MKQYIDIDKHTPPSGCLDFSWLLDAPAGCHGFVRAREGHLYFEDGTRAAFIGFNFPVRTAMPDHESAEVLANKMASLGVNVLRLCAADAPSSSHPRAWSTDPGFDLIDYSRGDSRHLNPAGLDRFDYFASCLRKKGIYLHFDLSVARGYPAGDELDYPPEGGFLPTQKMIQVLNRRLQDLQKEFATEILTHVNPYTGLSYAEEPQLMTVQVINEDSMFLNPDNMQRRGHEAYLAELQTRFGHFLLAKYGSRKHLAEAWTDEDGLCALGEEEDPAAGTVRILTPYVPINAFPNRNDPADPYDGPRSPARFADLNQFGIQVTRDYYRGMFAHLHSLGVRVPIAASNLIHGGPEVYAASEADVMENNAYWNHPFGRGGIPDPRDKVTTDPRIFGVSRPFVQPGTQELQLPQAAMAGKPFVVTEWNEYGSVMYSGASFPMVVAYACLQDWDGLIIYSYYTGGHSAFDQDHSFVADIMESYNDPALICQHGALSYMFLRRLVQPAKNSIEISHTMNDLGLLPPWYVMPYACLSYVSRVSLSFLDHGEHYRGSADVAVSSGHTPTGDYTEAKHAVVWSGTKWADAMRKSPALSRFLAINRGADARRIPEGCATLDPHALVIDEFDALLRDETLFSRAVDRAMKEWGILDGDRGLVDGSKFVSDTGEIRFCPREGRFSVDADRVACRAGDVTGRIQMGQLSLALRNDRITLSLIPLDGETLASSRHMLLTAVGRAGNDRTHFEGKKFALEGRLMMETAEGILTVPHRARLFALDVYGAPLREIPGMEEGGETRFELDGAYAANLEIRII